jgi:hypothetical protein
MSSAFIVAGKADDVGYAEAERLCDVLTAMLPSCVVVKLRIHPEDWEVQRANIGEALG